MCAIDRGDEMRSAPGSGNVPMTLRSSKAATCAKTLQWCQAGVNSTVIVGNIFLQRAKHFFQCFAAQQRRVLGPRNRASAESLQLLCDCGLEACWCRANMHCCTAAITVHHNPRRYTRLCNCFSPLLTAGTLVQQRAQDAPSRRPRTAARLLHSFLAANAKRRRSQVAASVCRPLATAAIIHIARQPRTDTRHGGRSHVCVSGAATTRRKHFKAAAALGPKRAAAALQFELLVGPHMGEGVALAAACVITAALLASLSRWVRDSCLRSSRKTIDAALVQGARCPRPPPRPTSRSPAL